MNQIKKSRFVIVIVLLLQCHLSYAMVKLPAIFSDHMVMQQKSKINMWGTAKNNAKIVITTSWNKKVYTGLVDKNGNWKLAIQTPIAGGPYEITFNDGQKLIFSDVLIGEVWLCSGQSNMEMPVKGFANQPVLHANEILLEAEQENIRLFRLERNMSETPVTDIKSKWENTNALSVRDFSAIAYQYAKILQQTLKVPIGIIQSAYGGTPIEAWMEKDTFKEFPSVKIPVDGSKLTKNNPSVLYNAMINPIVGYPIKGLLWYQGENNRTDVITYAQKMKSMVTQWRQVWNCGDWPVYYVQIAPNVYADKREVVPYFHETQKNAMKLIPKSGMVVSVDVGSQTTIHPPDKTIIAKRLAYWALANDYDKKGLAFMGPVYQSFKIDSNQITLNFSEIPNGLTSYDQSLLSFEIAGDDQIFHPANAKIVGKTVIVKSKEVLKPIAARYAFKDNAIGNLYNNEGLPAAAFRTDNWEVKK